MNAKDKMKKLGEKLGVNQGSMSWPQWSSALKAKAGKEGYSIDQLYDELILGKKQEVPKADPPKSAAPVPASMTLPAPRGSATSEVTVAAPTMTFNLAPPVIEVRHGEVTWQRQLERLGVYVFLISFGVVVGWITATPALKAFGLALLR